MVLMKWWKKTNHAIKTIHLVYKADYNINIKKIEKPIPDCDKYFTTVEFNKSMRESFAIRLK